MKTYCDFQILYFQYQLSELAFFLHWDKYCNYFYVQQKFFKKNKNILIMLNSFNPFLELLYVIVCINLDFPIYKGRISFTAYIKHYTYVLRGKTSNRRAHISSLHSLTKLSLEQEIRKNFLFNGQVMNILFKNLSLRYNVILTLKLKFIKYLYWLNNFVNRLD